ncbi:MAG: hypothetical protein [Malazfec virus 4]
MALAAAFRNRKETYEIQKYNKNNVDNLFFFMSGFIYILAYYLTLKYIKMKTKKELQTAIRECKQDIDITGKSMVIFVNGCDIDYFVEWNEIIEKLKSYHKRLNDKLITLNYELDQMDNPGGLC